MSSPTPRQVHVDRALTNISVAFIQKQTMFMAPQIFPVVPVDKQSDFYYVYDQEDWFRDEAKKRAPATESAGGGYNVSTQSYNADVWAFHKDVPDQVRWNEDAPLNSERDATQFVTQRLLLRQENQWAADYFVPNVWGTDIDGVAAAPGAGETIHWSDYANSDPIEDIEAGKAAILATTGFMPNTLVLGYNVFRRLKNHPDIVDRVKYTSSQTVTADMLARMFEVERVLPAMAIQNTAGEGVAASYSFIQGNHALLAYVAPNPSLLQPSAGYIFAWRGISGGMGQPIGVRTFRMEELAADRVEGQIAFDDKIVAPSLGYFFNGIVAS